MKICAWGKPKGLGCLHFGSQLECPLLRRYSLKPDRPYKAQELTVRFWGFGVQELFAVSR